MAPVQKRALYSLVIGLILSCVIIAVFIVKGGISAFEQDCGFRIIVYVIWIAVPLIYLILVNITLRKPQQLDERDRLVLGKAPKAQWAAAVFSLAAWVIVLTEVYHEQGQVPVIFLTLILLSTLIISTLALSLGIVLGYRQAQGGR